MFYMDESTLRVCCEMLCELRFAGSILVLSLSIDWTFGHFSRMLFHVKDWILDLLPGFCLVLEWYASKRMLKTDRSRSMVSLTFCDHMSCIIFHIFCHMSHTYVLLFDFIYLYCVCLYCVCFLCYCILNDQLLCLCLCHLYYFLVEVFLFYSYM